MSLFDEKAINGVPLKKNHQPVSVKFKCARVNTAHMSKYNPRVQISAVKYILDFVNGLGGYEVPALWNGEKEYRLSELNS